MQGQKKLRDIKSEDLKSKCQRNYHIHVYYIITFKSKTLFQVPVLDFSFNFHIES